MFAQIRAKSKCLKMCRLILNAGLRWEGECQPINWNSRFLKMRLCMHSPEKPSIHCDTNSTDQSWSELKIEQWIKRKRLNNSVLRPFRKYNHIWNSKYDFILTILLYFLRVVKCKTWFGFNFLSIKFWLNLFSRYILNSYVCMVRWLCTN